MALADSMKKMQDDMQRAEKMLSTLTDDVSVDRQIGTVLVALALLVSKRQLNMSLMADNLPNLFHAAVLAVTLVEKERGDQ
jgi:hypothetical protein